MRRSGLLVALVGVVLACGIGPTGQEAGAAPRARKTFVFGHDNGRRNRVFVFELLSDCSLQPVAGSPFDSGDTSLRCDGACQTAAYSAGARMLFTSGDQGVTAWRVRANGALAVVRGSPFGRLGPAYAGVAVVQRGTRRFVYASDFANDQIFGFRLKPDQTLTGVPGSPFAAGTETAGLSGQSGAGLLFVANQGGPTGAAIAAFNVKDNGRLVAAGAPFPVGAAGAFIYNVNVTPDGRCVFAADGLGPSTQSRVFAFSVNASSGALTAVPNSPFAASTARTSNGMAVTNDLAFAFGSQAIGTEDIQAYRIEDDCSLTALGGAQDTGLGGFMDSGALTRNGKCLVVASGGSDKVASLAVDPATGVVTPADQKTIAGARRISAVVIGRW